MALDIRVDEERATQRRAGLLNLQYVDGSQVPEKVMYKELISVPEMYQIRVFPLNADRSNILFGITNTTSQQAIKSLQQRFQDQLVKFALVSDSTFREYMRLYDPPKKISYQTIEVNNAGSEELVQQVSATLEQVRADDMLAYLVQQAHRLNASDIHMEVQPSFVRIRFRIDGVLHPIARLTFEKYRILLSAIASAGNISTGIDEAQQGHIAQNVHMATGEDVHVNIRLETVPTVNGTDVVMRLFNMDPARYRLDKLVLSEHERAVVDDIIVKPSGLVMIVGPTGSGKTTTLYSIMNTLNSDERKLITIEDPVEFEFPGISQISVRSGEHGNDDSFGAKLRAVLRLDPDVVMIGEIRDMDTARTALQGALTGHLVLCTFHANNAAAALTRLSDIIGENPLFVSAIRLVMAQRLVRKLDPDTKQEFTPDDATKAKIKEVLDTLPDDVEKPDINTLKLYKPGSSPENPYGYLGQEPVREQFLMSGELRELLSNPKGKIISTQSIEEAAVKSGMRTMLQDGILKVCEGFTTLEEVYRVVG